MFFVFFFLIGVRTTSRIKLVLFYKLVGFICTQWFAKNWTLSLWTVANMFLWLSYRVPHCKPLKKKIHSQQMNAVWHEVLWEQLLLPDRHTRELCSPGNGFGRRTKTVHVPQFKPPQTLLCLFGSDCMCINAYVMVFGAQCVFSDLCAESCDSWLIPLVYSLPFPPSCEAASSCQPKGEL